MISNIYSLPQIDFVGGSSESFIFNLYYSGDRDTPYGLVGCDANFSIINYINKNGDPVVSKKMNIEASSDSMFYNSHNMIHYLIITNINIYEIRTSIFL